MFRSLFVPLALLPVVFLGCRETPPTAEAPGPAVDEVPAYTHTRNLVAFGPRPPGSAGLKKSRDYIVGVLTKEGWQVVTQTFTASTPRGPYTFVNLIARYGDPDDSLWRKPITGIIGAHLDSKLMPPPNRFVGADDAASAVGVILELARTLKETPEHAAAVELVFFDGEEALGAQMTERDGIYGSRAYAQRWRQSPAKPAWGIILDMIGHRDLSIRLPSDSPEELVNRLTAVARDEKVADLFGMAEGPILDDHVPLNDAGIPTIDIIGDFANSSWWHTNQDNFSLISQESLEISQRVATALVKDLLENPPYGD